MEETKKKLYVEKSGFWTEASMLFMVLAMVCRVIGSIGRWGDMHYLVTMVALPVFSGLLFLLCLIAFGKRAFWTTVIPVVIGVVFFVFRAMNVENEWQMVAFIALYVVIVVLYTMTFSHPKLKWVLALVLLLAFAGHVVLQDLPVLMDLENPVSFVEGMQEMSILLLILSLLSVSFAMRMMNKPVKEKKRKTAAKESEAPAPEAIPAAESTQTIPAETPAPAYTPPVVPETEPVYPEAAPAVEETTPEFREPEEPAYTDHVPVQELELPGEPAEVYPLDNDGAEEKDKLPVGTDGTELP